MFRAGAEAGIKTGDVIAELNGKPVPKSHDLPSLIVDKQPGQKATLKMFRGKLQRRKT
ncbi:MAG: PDZ domain-containing protein [Candidatus Binatia bacterium]